MLRHATRTLLALAVALAAAPGEAALYRWVDELGVTHYATDLDSIPSDARDDALEIVASPPPVSATRALPVPPGREPVSAPAPEPAPEPVSAPAPAVAPEEASTPAATSAPPPVSAPAPELAPPAERAVETAAPEAAPPAPEPPGDAPPQSESSAPPTVFPGPPAAIEVPAGDPRAAEAAELEARIAADREQLRQMISTKRWDSAELASDPEIRAIAERLPRLQAELAALRAETVH